MFFTDEETLALCSKDETEDFSFAPEAVAKPENSKQISEIIILANENLIPVTRAEGVRGSRAEHCRSTEELFSRWKV